MISGVVSKIITEMGTMEVVAEGLMLTEVHPDYTVEDVQQATGCSLIISSELKAC